MVQMMSRDDRDVRPVPEVEEDEGDRDVQESRVTSKGGALSGDVIGMVRLQRRRRESRRHRGSSGMCIVLLSLIHGGLEHPPLGFPGQRDLGPASKPERFFKL